MFLKPRWFLIVFLLVAFSLQHSSPVGAAFVQNISHLYLSPVSYNSTAGSSFTVNVILNLAAGQNITGFDVKLNYTNPQPFPVVRAQNISYSGGIFGPDIYVSQECIPGSPTNPGLFCQTSDITDVTPGWVHFSTLSNSGNPVTGPRTALLFSVSFNVNETLKDSSLIRIHTANLGNSGSGPYATAQFIPTTTEDAIFSNSGVTPFFNFMPSDTASVVVDHFTSFDAGGSFNANDSSIRITNYLWNFGDGNNTSTTSPVIQHRFRSPNNYDVSLTITDANGKQNLTHRTVSVGPALGALLLTVYSLQKILQPGVLVQLFNSSVIFPFANATTDSGGLVTFQDLLPGFYTLGFSGPYVKNSTVTEIIYAGWTTQDSVGIEVDPPPPPPLTPWYGEIIFLASMAGALGVFGLGLFLRRRSTRNKLRARRTSLKKRQWKG